MIYDVIIEVMQLNISFGILLDLNFDHKNELEYLDILLFD